MNAADRTLVLANLQAARLLIDDRANWTRGTNAVNRRGKTVPSFSSAAVRWCARGAISATEPDMCWVTLGFINSTLERKRPLDTLETVNDALGHKSVLRLLDWLIVQCLKEMT